MRFRVKNGKYREDDRDYKRGDVVVTDKDLVKAFGEHMFERLPDVGLPAPTPDAVLQAAAEKGAAELSPPSSPAGESEESTEEDKATSDKTEPSGEDVTGQFPKAPEAGFKVFKRDDLFYVYDPDDMSKAVNEKRKLKTPDSVTKFIESFLNG